MEPIWIVSHGRGVVQSGSATNVARFLATAASLEGKTAFFYFRYDDAPERVYVPFAAYAIVGTPKLEEMPPEELEPVGEIFDATVILDPAMIITGTSQRASIFDGLKQGGTIVVNSSLPLDTIKKLLKEAIPPGTSWKGKTVILRAADYDRDVAIACSAAVAKATNVVDVKSVAKAFEQLGVPKEKSDVLKKAYDEAEIKEVSM